MSKKILVADTPEGDRRLSQILSGYELTFVRTMGEARRELEADGFVLILVGVHFDDSRMFDLLRQVRSEGRNKDIPIICVREPGLGFTAISSHTLEVTCRALDANVFLDLTNINDEPGRDAALRAAVEGLLPNA